MQMEVSRMQPWERIHSRGRVRGAGGSRWRRVHKLACARGRFRDTVWGAQRGGPGRAPEENALHFLF